MTRESSDFKVEILEKHQHLIVVDIRNLAQGAFEQFRKRYNFEEASPGLGEALRVPQSMILIKE